jgi:WD40 repeat protein
MFDLDSNRIFKTFEGHSDNVNYAAFNTDNTLMVSGSSDYTIRIWDVKTGKQVLCINDDNCINSVAFSPNGNEIISASGYEFNSAYGAIKVWNSETGTLVFSKEEDDVDTIVNYAAFNIKGDRIASVKRDGTIEIWKWDPLQLVIDKNRKRFENRQLTPKERKMYYLD